MLTGDQLPQASHDSMLGSDAEKPSLANGSSFAGDEIKYFPSADPCAMLPDLRVGEVGLEEEVDRLAQALSLKFEELTLIHQLSSRLKLGEDASRLCQTLLDELESCVNATTIAIDLYEDEEYDCEGIFLSSGQPVQAFWLRGVADDAKDATQAFGKSPSDEERIAIHNHPAPDAAQLRVVVVPLQRESKSLGQMIAIRPVQAPEFGTIEADLMKSTSMILAAHLINQRQYLEMQQMFEGTIQSLVSALDAKDTYTCGHSARVADLAVELAERLGFDADGIKRIRMAGILHDIGKIGVEDSVLRKPGRLNDVEFEKIKQHPVLGFEILQGIRPFRKILPAVRHHHESWDGTGYPDGLAGERIPRDAQVLAVADAFDAMTSDRPYRNGMPLDRVIDIFRQGRGSQWAADVVDVLLSCPETMHAYVKRKGEESPREGEFAGLD
jgi:putative nucleotidyltransferase with HDIG domain